MWAIAWKFIQWALDKYNVYVVGKGNVDLEKEHTEQNNDNAKAAVLGAGAFWFQLFFIVPLALWFAAVVLYSIFWCKACMAPQPWTIAALPDPLNAWAGAIIGFLFLVHTVKKL